MRVVAVVLLVLLGCAAPSSSEHLKTDAGVPVKWDSRLFPLKLVIDESLPEELKLATLIAATKWNMETGVEVFEVSTALPDDPVFLYPGPLGHVAVTYGTVRGKGPAFQQSIAIAEHYIPETHAHSGNLLYGRILFEKEDLQYFSEQMPMSLVFFTALHEMGHILGLAHDLEDRMSLMYPSVPADPDLFWVMRPEDVDFVRRMVLGDFDEIPARKTNNAYCNAGFCLTP